MEDERKESWLGNHLWVLPLICGIIALIGLALPLVAAHPVTYDPATWTFGEEKRVEMNAAILFGFNGAVAWPYFIPYGFLLAAVLLLIPFATTRKEGLAAGSMMLFILSAVLLFVSNSFYGFSNAIATVGSLNYASDDRYWYIKTYIATADGRLGIGAILSGTFACLGALTAFSASMSKRSLDVRSMVEIAMLCAIAVVLDLIFHYIPSLPGQVGSLSISLVPLYIIALRHGPSRGLFASSIVYGLITCITDGYGIWLYPLDYFVAFSGVAILGFFGKPILEKKDYNLEAIVCILGGCVAAGFVRFIGSGVSSIVNYGYTFLAACIANLYAFGSALASALVLIALYRPLIHLNSRFPVRVQAEE